jgi:hypothetical protein
LATLKTKRGRKLPLELREGLNPGLTSDERDAALSKKLAALFIWYNISPADPHCWQSLSVAMAEDHFAGFRNKTGRKPKKWTVPVFLVLGGEMRREIDGGARSQEQAAKRLAMRNPWKTFLLPGRWRDGSAREPWENLLYQFTRMRRPFKEIGRDAYLMHVHEGSLGAWDASVQDILEFPVAPLK